MSKSKIFKKINNFNSKRIKKIQSIFILLSIAFLFSCSTKKPAFTKSAAKLYESFYLGSETMQYFVKPLSFKNDSNSIALDITFKNSPSGQDSSTVNLSLFSQNFYKKINNISIENDSTKINLDNITFMFSEKQAKNYLSRFTAKLKNTDIQKIFKNSNWKISVDSENVKSDYLPSKKTFKNIEKLNGEIFILAAD